MALVSGQLSHSGHLAVPLLSTLLSSEFPSCEAGLIVYLESWEDAVCELYHIPELNRALSDGGGACFNQ